jgi:hypothetical protein
MPIYIHVCTYVCMYVCRYIAYILFSVRLCLSVPVWSVSSESPDSLCCLIETGARAVACAFQDTPHKWVWVLIKRGPSLAAYRLSERLCLFVSVCERKGRSRVTVHGNELNTAPATCSTYVSIRQHTSAYGNELNAPALLLLRIARILFF